METKKKNAKSFLPLAIFLFSIATTNAQKYNVKNGTAFFKAKISINSYIGTSEELTGFIDLNFETIEFSIPSKSIKTPNKKRNKHMYELINIEEHTNVTFKGGLLDNFNIDKKEKQTLKVKGDFTLAGATQEIELSIDLTPIQKGLHLEASWSLLITDYGIEPPTKVFMTVKDKHEMAVDAFLEIE
jgi:polyisoprenoid-binding protein YceI